MQRPWPHAYFSLRVFGAEKPFQIFHPEPSMGIMTRNESGESSFTGQDAVPMSRALRWGDGNAP